MIKRFSKVQISILEKLGVYKFLTYSRLIKLEVAKSNAYLSKHMKDLLEAGFVYKLTRQRTGLKEDLFYLSKKGGEYIGELLEFNAIYPKNKYYEAPNKMSHRFSIIDFHIDISCLDLVFCYRDFDHFGSQKGEEKLRAKTSITYRDSYITPDLVFLVSGRGEQYLFLVEIELTSNKRKSKEKFYEKFKTHVRLMETYNVNDTFNFEYDYKVLIQVDDKEYIDYVIKKAKKENLLQGMEEAFLFRTPDNNIFNGWVNLKGEERLLL